MNINQEKVNALAATGSNANLNPEKFGRPYVRIVEQPRSRGLRFRYQCEGRLSGSIVGENSCTAKKTFPTIEIINNQRPAFIVVSCVTKNPPHQPHPHSIAGKGKEFSHGLYHLKVPAGQNVISFPRMTIQCVKKTEAMAALEERKRQRVDPFMTGYPNSVKNIDLSCIRLCFQVFLEGQQEGAFKVALEPIVSQPIYDKKSSVEFVILWISHASAGVAGGKTICIICDKVAKDDIQVIFFCEKSGWEVPAEFTCPSVHKQVAVVVKTPSYYDQEVAEPVQIQVMLRRPSTGTTSNPVPFQFLPMEPTNRDLARAKRRRLCMTPRNLVEQHMKYENQQAPLQLSRNVVCSGTNLNGASTSAINTKEKDRLSQVASRLIPSRQTAKPKEKNMQSNLSDFLKLNNLDAPPPAPKTPVEFRQILDSYMFSDSQQNFHL